MEMQQVEICQDDRMKNLSAENLQLLDEIGSNSPLAIEEVADRIDNVRALIKLGLVRLIVVQSLWGTEFKLAVLTS